jgi:serine/threonine protein kinase
MYKKGELLIGKIAIKEGLMTKEQVLDCLIAQDYNPGKPLGSIMVEKGYITGSQLEHLLELQKKAIAETSLEAIGMPKGTFLFGKLLIQHGFATEFQVNDCLKLQGEFYELGIEPVPPLGEIMVKKGYIRPETVELVLQLQNLALYTCPKCGKSASFEQKNGEFVCATCKNPVPPLFAQLSKKFIESAQKTSDEFDLDLPGEVSELMQRPENHFGKYVLVEQIGKGGSSVVYKAWYKPFNKFVALKILQYETETGCGVKTPFGDVEDLKRFYSEIRSATELNHPNIVPIYEFDIVENKPYIAMKFIEGQTLEQILSEEFDEREFDTTYIITGERQEDRPQGQKGLSLRSALKVIRDVALALDYAHQKGVYHRDIKPQNIMIDYGGKTWVTDFGIAKLKKVGDPAYKKGVIMGTPSYMPPEQAAGDMEQVDHLSDIYSLGAVLYELLTNRPPYSKASPTQTIDQVLIEKVEPPTKYNPSIPPEVEAIVLKCLRRKKRDRYLSAQDLANDIDDFLEGKTKRVEKKGFFDKLFSFLRLKKSGL